METLVTIVSFSLIIAVITAPIIILTGLKKLNVRKYKFLTYLVLGIATSVIITLAFGWWSDASNEILLSHYGYNFDSMSEAERFANVSAENLERVKRLEISRMGIGWPLKSIMIFELYSPYILMLYLVVYLLQKSKKKNTDTQSTY